MVDGSNGHTSSLPSDGMSGIVAASGFESWKETFFVALESADGDGDPASGVVFVASSFDLGEMQSDDLTH